MKNASDTLVSTLRGDTGGNCGLLRQRPARTLAFFSVLFLPPGGSNQLVESPPIFIGDAVGHSRDPYFTETVPGTPGAELHTAGAQGGPGVC